MCLSPIHYVLFIVFNMNQGVMEQWVGFWAFVYAWPAQRPDPEMLSDAAKEFISWSGVVSVNHDVYFYIHVPSGR